MTRPTLDDLREEDSPGILRSEALERLAPEMYAFLVHLRQGLDDSRRIVALGEAELAALEAILAKTR